MDKAHIEHAVGLIQYEEVQCFERYVTLGYQVQQAPRGGNQYLYTIAQRVRLRFLTHSAKDDSVLQSGVFAICLKTFTNLNGQLPGWG